MDEPKMQTMQEHLLSSNAATASTPRALLRAMFDAAVASAQPERCVQPHLPEPSSVRGRLLVIGAGKASAAMARAVEQHWPGPLSGLVVTRYGYGAACERIEIVEAAHPVPDVAGERAAARMLDLCDGLGEADTVLCLISGGGSSLLPLPLPGVTLADKQALSRALLQSGATIREINCVRRHLSAIKGGRLAAACHPARVLTLLISDVPGDDPTDIASGPTVADSTTCADALDILRRYAIDVPKSIQKLLESGEGESIKPGDPRLARCEARIVAAPQQALEAAALVAEQAGYAAHILSDALEGEAREMGTLLAGIARQVAERGQPVAAPCVLLSGGESTVTVQGKGRGGAQRGMPAGLCDCTGRAPAHPWPCGRHRWRRWPGRNCGGVARSRHAGTGLGIGKESPPELGGQRWARFFWCAWRCSRYGADAHQCERLSRVTDTGLSADKRRSLCR